MQDVRYIISDASKKIDVEQYTLRYWEDELGLHIQRNEMGHRYYTEEDLRTFTSIKILKDKGYQLRAIKMMLPDIIEKSASVNNESDMATDVLAITKEYDKNQIDIKPQEILVDEPIVKLDKFKAILSSLMVQAVEDNNEKLSLILSDNITTSVIKEMEYLLRVKEEREEERFKQFDRTLREVQNGRMEVAATKLFKNKRRNLFKK